MSTEHIIQLSSAEKSKLALWLTRPNGSCPLNRVTFEAVTGGGILVRTRGYEGEELHPKRPRSMPGLADIVTQSLLTTGQRAADEAQTLVNNGKINEAKIEAAIATRLGEVATLINEAVRD
jgi:hypothetical protein